MNTLPAYVVDTSVAVKWFVDEGGAEQTKALQLFESFEQRGCSLKAPQLLLIELANALMCSHRLGVRRIVEVLTSVQQLNIDLEFVRAPTLAKAVEIADSCGATVYDSYFLALALETNSVLVTADDAFLRKARHWPRIVALRSLQLPGPTP